MSTLRDKVFYCDSDKKKKALVKVLLSKGESVGPVTRRGRALEYPYVYFSTENMWSGMNCAVGGRELVKL